MLTSATSGVSADFKPAPIADDDLAYLVRLLFDKPALEGADARTLSRVS